MVIDRERAQPANDFVTQRSHSARTAVHVVCAGGERSDPRAWKARRTDLGAWVVAIGGVEGGRGRRGGPLKWERGGGGVGRAWPTFADSMAVSGR